MCLFIHVCVYVFPRLSFTLREALLPVSRQNEVTCSHTVALLAWLCPTRVPSACPRRGPESSPVDLGISQSHRIVALCSWLMNHRPSWVTFCSSLQDFGEGSGLHHRVVRTVLLIPRWLRAVMGPNTSCCSCFPFPISSQTPLVSPHCCHAESFFPNTSSSQHLQAPSTSLPSKPVHLSQHPCNSSTLFPPLCFPLCPYSLSYLPSAAGNPSEGLGQNTGVWSGTEHVEWPFLS